MTRLGRTGDCTIPIDQAEVSRIHAIIRCIHDQYFIEDGDGNGKASQNGTFVNDEQITEATLLKNLDRIKIGAFVCTFLAGRLYSTFSDGLGVHPSSGGRLSAIHTDWNLLRKAQDRSGDDGLSKPDSDVRKAQELLVEQYYQPVRRYLLGAFRGNEDAVEEVLQAFLLKLVQGDFWRADPNKGRFRDYLKTALGNLVKNFQRREWGKSLDPLPADLAEEQLLLDWTPDEEAALTTLALIERAKAALRTQESQRNVPWATVLEWHEKNLHTSIIAERIIAERLAFGKRKKPYSPASVRKILQRAREKLADLLLDEVAAAFGATHQDELEQALVELKLLEHCREALSRRFSP